MSVSTVPLTPNITQVLGAGAVAETTPQTALNAQETALLRASHDDYHRWINHINPAAGCSNPVRLVGTVETVNTATGEISSRSTDDMPDGMIYKACGNRRKSVCPACAEIYRGDAYQLVLAGLQGGKGIPESVSTHPAVFFTATAPSFGHVHTRRIINGKTLACRPRRKPQRCRHGVQISCNRIHDDGDQLLGTPFCLDCYKHAHQVVWNVFSGELFRRTKQELDRIIARHAKAHGDKGRIRVSYGKVAEMQRRGVVHFHGIARFDGIDPHNKDEIVAPPEWATIFVLAHTIREAFEKTTYTTPPHKTNPAGWYLEWGNQLDTRPVHLRGADPINNDRILTEATATGRRRTLSVEAVSGYLAKYATKSTEDTGHLSRRLTLETIGIYADHSTHTGRLIETCWRLGAEPLYRRLRRWAHTLGYGGHFFTKSRRYTTTFGRLRQTRTEWRRHNTGGTDVLSAETIVTITALEYAGTGWQTTGDALLANTSAAMARAQRRQAKEEIHDVAI